MSYIEIKNYTKKIKKNIILDDITLNLEKNKIYGFVGINGSGKTMLFRAITGLISPTNGSITVNGIKVGKGIHPEKVGMVIENADLWGELSALENLKILNQMSSNQSSVEELKKLLTEFSLDPNSKKPYKAFSLGMKQKLRLSQAFMGNPELLILDEPTNALDEESVQKVIDKIIKMKNEGATVLIASHSSEDIKKLCEEILYMKEGRITERVQVRINE